MRLTSGVSSHTSRKPSGWSDASSHVDPELPGAVRLDDHLGVAGGVPRGQRLQLGSGDHFVATAVAELLDGEGGPDSTDDADGGGRRQARPPPPRPPRMRDRRHGLVLVEAELACDGCPDVRWRLLQLHRPGIARRVHGAAGARRRSRGRSRRRPDGRCLPLSWPARRGPRGQADPDRRAGHRATPSTSNLFLIRSRLRRIWLFTVPGGRFSRSAICMWVRSAKNASSRMRRCG